jgi:alpha-ketoglutarate-dependent taurine dioxygenase
MNFGDGSEFSRADLMHFMGCYDENAIEVKWKEGDLLIFCNYRFAHGRPAYTVPEGQSRELYVTMGPPLKRRGQVY